MVDTENLEDKFCGNCTGEVWVSTSGRRCIWVIRLRLIRMNTTTPRVNESRPRNDSTVMVAIKDSESARVDTAFCTGEGDGGTCDACELEYDCTSADVADTVAWVDEGEGVGLGTRDVLDTKVPAVAEVAADGPAPAEPPFERVTTDGAGTAGSEDGRMIVGVSGDTRGTVG